MGDEIVRARPNSLARIEVSVDLREFFSRDIPARVILEGGSHKGWAKLRLDIGEFLIHEGTLRIHPGIDYDLNLMARLDGARRMESVDVEPTEALRIGYSIFRGIDRPRGLMTDDGRLFYDLSLLSGQPNLAGNFLKYFEMQFNEGKSFHQIYLEIKEGQ